jgi:GNAT superfamily N-acetyltransferase
MNWLEVIGWIGSILVVVSLMQARVLRFRVLNLTGAVLATAYNLAIEVWPFAAMNGAIAIIDVYWLLRLLRERHDEAAYEVVEVRPDDAYLARLLEVHAADIARFSPAGPGAASEAFLVVRGDETVGVVQVHDEGAGVGRVQLDYVTPRFRDFTPGEFVYRRSGVFRERGYTRLVVDPVPANRDYFRRVGFVPPPDAPTAPHSTPASWTRDLTPA